MSRLHKLLNNEYVARFLVTGLMAWGLSSVCCVGFFPAPNMLHIALWCMGFAGGGTLFSAWRFRLKLPFLLLMVAGLILSGIFLKFGPIHAGIEAVKAFLYLDTGWTEILAVYADMILPIFCLIITLVSFGTAMDENGFSCVLFTFGVCTMMFLLRPMEQMLLLALPAFMGAVLQLSRKHRFAFLALPAAVLLGLCAFAITPQNPPISQPMADKAREIREFIEDHFLYTEKRSSFSLLTEGYLPLEERLGGKANPTNRSVMEVKTDVPLLLRGKTYDFYTGISWEDSLSSKRYLYHSLYSRDLRSTLFQMEKPLAGAENIPLKKVEVTLLQDGTTTLFAPTFTREMSMQGKRMVLYFNTAGELFLTRDTLENDNYSLSYLPLEAESSETARIVAACAQTEDPYYDTVCDQYLTLPSIQQEVHDIAARAADPDASPYEKALQIKHYLQSHYAYSLDVQTPEMVDFVAWFLLGEQKGYCTYFASAMTVLCRMNGIPARYVTGYLAEPDENGVAHVRGKNAHAWTEIYLKGFGWLAVDATGMMDGDENAGNTTPPSPPPVSPTATPIPSPEPPAQDNREITPTPSPAPSSVPTPSQEPQENPAASPSPPPAPDSNQNQETEKDTNLLSFLPWVILLLIIILLVLRYYFTRPQTQAKRKKADGVQVYYAAMEMLLAGRSIRRLPQETLHLFAERCAQQGYGETADAVWAYAAHVYSHHPGDADRFAGWYLSLYCASTMPQKIAFTLKRMLGKR